MDSMFSESIFDENNYQEINNIFVNSEGLM